MLNKFLIGSALAFTALSAMPAAAVSISGATNIRVSNSIGEWLQVAELQAWTFTPTNVALQSNGGLATASSFYSGISTPDKANDGNTGGSYSTDYIYHSGSPSGSEYLDVAFAASNLSSVTIFGRTDGSSFRDVYNIEIFNAAGLSLYRGGLDARNGPATVTFGNAVPEPAAWALLITGFTLVGGALRTRRKTVAA